jgi:hypothetical protein
LFQDLETLAFSNHDSDDDSDDWRAESSCPTVLEAAQKMSSLTQHLKRKEHSDLPEMKTSDRSNVNARRVLLEARRKTRDGSAYATAFDAVILAVVFGLQSVRLVGQPDDRVEVKDQTLKIPKTLQDAGRRILKDILTHDSVFKCVRALSWGAKLPPLAMGSAAGHYKCFVSADGGREHQTVALAQANHTRY